MITAHWVILATLLQAPVTPAPVAQADSGSRVRITVDRPSKHSHFGTLVSADADSLRFTTDSTGVVAIPTASVTRLERSRGRHSNAGRGAVIGGVIGGAAGIILGIAASADESSYVDTGPEGVLFATAILGATGAGLGALIGAASKRDRWEPVAIPGRIAQQVLPGQPDKARVASGSVGVSAILRDAMPTLR